jgi:ribosomal protein L16 Arg81 hydroxylase
MTAVYSEPLLRRLTGSMSLQEFNRDFRERQVGFFANAIPPDELRELFSLPRLEALFANEAVLAPYVDIFDGQHLRRLVDVQRKSGKSCLEVANECLAGGATIRVRDADRFDGHLSRFSGGVQRKFVADVQVNVYLTPPGRNGFPPHFDITDAFVIQCLGSKAWRFYPEYSNMVELPMADTNWEPDRYQPSGPAEAFTLAQGDVLYLPRGAMHQASCTERESMHLTVSIAPMTVADVLVKAVRRAAESDIELRRRVPWTDEQDGVSPDLVLALRKALLNLPQCVDFRELLRAEHPAAPEPESTSKSGFASTLAGLLERVRLTRENDLHSSSRALSTEESS